ncbi:dihydrofolate reductase [Sediminibacterium ginsengisoli]|uniref:Dihydrofolate reductase n=1 Tax=Sediminibacterium ginsengisoli TaxID=413434 RepID=A0A1T4KNV8_9BACT|nr:dihydrofolate reductase [Sediminibacterium ginsengisoli]SJZ44116.1 dihydrofolate reductase [Sediminibacterium ginsengisoli]
MLISLVVAAAENNAIGKDNRLLWKLPNDMRFFKSTTWAMPVVMGRKTFESLSGKPLQGRLNIVITRQQDFQAEGIVVVHSLEAAISEAEKADYKEVYVIGGGEIYKASLPQADKVYLTKVHTQIDGDTFFPELDPVEWKLASEHRYEADEKHAYAYSFQVWDRIRS